MTIEILSYKPYGPYQSINTKEEVGSLTEFIRQVRSCFDEAVTAVAVIKDGFAVALWIAEPDIDCDIDGPYEVKPAYPGQEFVRYEATSKSFWDHVAGYFGARYIPEGVGFIAKFPRQAQQNSVNQHPDGAEALTAAERNPSMVG